MKSELSAVKFELSTAKSQLTCELGTVKSELFAVKSELTTAKSQLTCELSSVKLELSFVKFELSALSFELSLLSGRAKSGGKDEAVEKDDLAILPYEDSVAGGDLKDGLCKFFVWEDPPMCRRSKVVIPGLLNRLNNKDNEIYELRGSMAELKNNKEKEMAEMRRTIAELEYAVSALQGLNGRNLLLSFALGVSWMFFLSTWLGVTPCGVPNLALGCSSTNGVGALMFTLEVAGISALEC
ncbi:hypothetical protein BUALT_Bualt17G0043400 [Buddleja alternifolia]|uniref:Uncharacterized protein n=1 Tax=Buddleja alternifolia TaxID=168488 RepID=A0AAV6W6Q1_9LAMI|nr:hypothetical protein BUALT_Bualt17G0043400 [Buddleja alternifolia]